MQESFTFTLVADAWSGAAEELAQLFVCLQDAESEYYCQLSEIVNPGATTQAINYYVWKTTGAMLEFGSASDLKTQMESKYSTPLCTMTFDATAKTSTTNCNNPPTVFDSTLTSVGANTVTFAANISENFTSEADQDTYSTYISTGMKTLQVAAYYNNGTFKYEQQGIFDATAKTPVTGGASSMAVFGAALTALAAFAF